MGILSARLLTFLAVAAFSLPALSLLLWTRVRGAVTLRAAQRVGLVVTSQVLAVALAAAYVNDQYAFYVSWHDLLGKPTAPGSIVATSPLTMTGRDGAELAAGASAGSGVHAVHVTVRGARSGLIEPVTIYLPVGYGDPRNAGVQYPVVEFLAGWHGGPESWRRALHLPATLNAEQAAGRVQPFIAVVPTTDVALPRDVECADLPGVIRAETWLTSDLRSFVTRTFRASYNGYSWGLVGYSTGAYCAAKFVLHHPTWYRSAVLMSGYYSAIRDRTTGDLWGGRHTALSHRNDPMWMLEHGNHPAVDLLAFSNTQDRESYSTTLRLLQVAVPPTRTYRLIAPTGGHNLRELSAALPQLLDWLSDHLRSAQQAIVPVNPSGSRQALGQHPPAAAH